MIDLLQTLGGLGLLAVLIIFALKFISYVVTGEWRLFPKD